MRRHLGRLRESTDIKMPARTAEEVAKCFEDDEILKKHGFCKDGSKRFYQTTFMSTEFSYTIFVSWKIIEKLDNINEKKYLADGTFKVVPSGEFEQLLIIHVEYLNHVSCLNSKLLFKKKYFLI